MKTENETKSFERIFSFGPESSLLIQRMKGGKPGDLLSDEELQKVSGRDCSPGGSGYGCLQTAIRHCEREGVVWLRIPGSKQVKCLEPGEVLSCGTQTLRHINKQSKRATLRLGSMDDEALSADERRRRNALITQAGALAFFTRTSTVKLIEKRSVTATVDPSRMLEIFK